MESFLSSALPVVHEDVRALLNTHGYHERKIFGVMLSLEEAIANALKHGHRGDRSKPIDVNYDITSQKCVITVIDTGQGFDPSAIPDPREPENLERCCGRGVFLMRHYCDEVTYNERGNEVTFVVKH